jgi:hypothetical protein
LLLNVANFIKLAHYFLQCPDSASKKDLLAYLQRIALYCQQLNITSKVKADVQNVSGELIVSGVRLIRRECNSDIIGLVDVFTIDKVFISLYHMFYVAYVSWCLAYKHYSHMVYLSWLCLAYKHLSHMVYLSWWCLAYKHLSHMVYLSWWWLTYKHLFHMVYLSWWCLAYKHLSHVVYIWADDV